MLGAVRGGFGEWGGGRAREVAFLVDEHLLDTYLAASALRPQTAYLLYTEAVAGPLRRLATVLVNRLGIQAVGVEVSDPTSRESVRMAWQALPGSVHLHHTGGVGAMQGHSRAVFAEREGSSGRASYLDEERRLLRHDDGDDVALWRLVDPAEVTAGVLCELYGLEQLEPDPVVETEIELVWRAFRTPSPWHDFSAAETATQVQAALARARPPRGRLARDGYWAHFCGGPWLERLVAGLARHVAPGFEVLSGVRLSRGEAAMEVDVLVVGHFRPFVISCMTGHSGAEAKQKLFEVQVRAEQIGGAAARPALVSLVDGASRPDPSHLRATVDPGWDAPSEPRVFAAPEIGRWLASLAGKDTTGLEDLREFLED